MKVNKKNQKIKKKGSKHDQLSSVQCIVGRVCFPFFIFWFSLYVSENKKKGSKHDQLCTDFLSKLKAARTFMASLFQNCRSKHWVVHSSTIDSIVIKIDSIVTSLPSLPSFPPSLPSPPSSSHMQLEETMIQTLKESLEHYEQLKLMEDALKGESKVSSLVWKIQPCPQVLFVTCKWLKAGQGLGNWEKLLTFLVS